MKSWIEYEFNKVYGIPFIIPSRIIGLQKNNDHLIEMYVNTKKALNSIEFSCFKPDGNCHVRKGHTCCCHSCFTCRGHFGVCDIIFEKDIKTYNKLFSQKTGFWIKSKGCRLPRELRSITCISYSCEKEDKAIIITSLENELKDVSEKIRTSTANYLSRHIIRRK